VLRVVRRDEKNAITHDPLLMRNAVIVEDVIDFERYLR
jgi:hypothetical protein